MAPVPASSTSSSPRGPSAKLCRVCFPCHARYARFPFFSFRTTTLISVCTQESTLCRPSIFLETAADLFLLLRCFPSFQVSCDLLRPACTACVKYRKGRPTHVCVYGPDAAAPGQPKTQSGNTHGGGEAASDVGTAKLMPARTRGASRAIQAFVDEAGMDEAEMGDEVQLQDEPEEMSAFPPLVPSPSFLA
jgi:hypothetical protein